jgi:protein SCO1
MGSFMSNMCHAARRSLMGSLLAIMLFPGISLAHLEGETHAAPGLDSPMKGDAGVKVGVDEKLGSKVPLDLVFRDESGRARRLGEMITGPTIIVPVYYGCSNVCNYLQGDLARVLPSVQRKPGVDYRILSVSMDETETPALADKYKKMYLTSMKVSFPQDGWHFLTGDLASIKALTDSAGYRFQHKGHDFMHPVASFVVSGDGLIVRYLYGTSFLSKDLTLAIIEAHQGKVGTTIRKVVGYCFSFDPAGKSYQFNLLRVSATVVILCCGGFLAYLLATGRRKRNPSGEK